MAVASWPRVSARLMEVLLGHSVWAALFRRCGLAVFDGVFKFIQDGEAADPHAARMLPGRVRWELLAAAALMCLLTVSLRASPCAEVIATDASPWGFGVVSARPGLGLVEEALRFGELRGEYVSLTGGVARRPAQGDRVAAASSLPAAWSDVGWQTKIARPWRVPLAQAVNEVQAAGLAAEWSARKVANHGGRQLLLLDARAALGAWAKGRSSSWPFLRVLRRVAALSLATGIEWIVRWVASEDQPADAASRRFESGPGHDWKRGQRLGEADRPGPLPRRPLRGAHLAPGTVEVYLKAFLFDFYEWVVQEGLLAGVRSVADLDSTLVDWMEARYEEGRRATVGSYVLGAVKLLSARVYAELHEARSLHIDWLAAHKTVHWPPLSLPLVLLLACDQLEHGSVDAAFSFLLAFAGLLRSGEMARLRVRDVVFPGDARLWGLDCVLLVLQHTKTGDDKSAEVPQPWLRPFLARWVARRRAQVGAAGRLCLQAAALREALRASLGRLGLGNAGFVLHRLRSGGGFASPHPWALPRRGSAAGKVAPARECPAVPAAAGGIGGVQHDPETGSGARSTPGGGAFLGPAPPPAVVVSGFSPPARMKGPGHRGVCGCL